MMRRIVALGLLCGSLACAQPASAQGLWIGGLGFGGVGVGPAYNAVPFGVGGGFFPYGPYGFGGPAAFGGYAPATFAYPVMERPVYVARPVIYDGFPAYAPRPAVQAPLNRAYRRAWRKGW